MKRKNDKMERKLIKTKQMTSYANSALMQWTSGHAKSDLLARKKTEQ